MQQRLVRAWFEPEFPRSMNQPDQPGFWDQRYAADRTPWDFAGVPAALTTFLAEHPGRGTRVLIPGCGSGYEVEAFVRAGYLVTAIDFSAPAIERARTRFGHLGQDIMLGDFFTQPFDHRSFDVIYERTFLCALPPERWTETAARIATLLRPNGLLAGIFFFGDKEDGPPFGLAAGEAEALFGQDFTLVDDRAVNDSLPLFAERERWQVRRREVAH